MEMQILDDADAKYTDLHDYQVHGSLYGLAPPSAATCGPSASGTIRKSPSTATTSSSKLNGYEILNADIAKVREKPLDGKDHPGARRTTATSASAATTTPSPSATSASNACSNYLPNHELPRTSTRE